MKADLKIQIPFAASDSLQAAFGFGPDGSTRYLGQVLPDSRFSRFPGGRSGVIQQVFFKGQDGVGLAYMLDLAGFGQGHKTVPCTPAAITGRAVAG